ncbi:transcription elongation factor TFIIS [Tanacetum coccineum]
MSEFRNRSDGGMIVPVELLSFAKGKKNKKLFVRSTDCVHYVSIKYINVSFALVFGKAWNRYVKSKGIEVGWHVHFVVSSRLSMLFVAEYNLEGMPTSRLYNFGKYAPVCLTYASSQSKHIQILPKRYFDGFKKKDLCVFDAIGKYEVKLQFIEDAPRGFCGLNWTDFLVSENVSEGQKMVVCHAGGFRFNVNVFNFNGVAIETFFLVLADGIECF